MKKLCIYHSNCLDGFGAAWVVRRKYGDDVEFHAGVYQDAPPDVTGRDVIIVDFSYKLDVMYDLCEKANSVLVIDHHKTAITDLADFVQPGNNRVRFVFDTSRSGVALTWLHYFSNEHAPNLLRHIEDRDLWRFTLPKTREINAALFSYPYDFGIWDALIEVMDAEPMALAREGEAINRAHLKNLREYIKVAATRGDIAGHEVPVINCPYMWASDAGNIMAVGEKFAASWWDGPTHRNYSLRSADDGIDVSEVAKGFGGGGHKHAAGFKLPLPVEGEVA